MPLRLGNSQVARLDDRDHTIALIRILRRARLQRRRRPIPRPMKPTLIVLAYQTALIAILDRAAALVRHELSLELGVRLDVEKGPPPGLRINRAVERAAKRFYETAFRPVDAEALASRMADRTVTLSRESWARQVRAGLGVDLLGAEPDLRPAVEQSVARSVALIKSVPSEYFSDLEKTLTQEVTAGTRPEDIAKMLRDEYGIAERRAALIARDQTGKLYGALAQERQQALGVTAFIWRGVKDDRERDEHVECEGDRFEWDNPPEDGIPGEPVNCRCWAEPDLSALLDEAD